MDAVEKLQACVSQMDETRFRWKMTFENGDDDEADQLAQECERLAMELCSIGGVQALVTYDYINQVWRDSYDGYVVVPEIYYDLAKAHDGPVTLYPKIRGIT